MYLLINGVNKISATGEIMRDNHPMTLVSGSFPGSDLLLDVMLVTHEKRAKRTKDRRPLGTATAFQKEGAQETTH